MPNVIEAFLANRKEAREKKPDGRTQTQIDEEFHQPTWVTNAAKRARQLTRVTHPAKFSHPAADASAMIAVRDLVPDGFLRTGNVADVPSDVFGNAAALDVYAFLSVLLDDGRSILDHLRSNTDEIKQMLGFDDEEFQRIRYQFLAIEIDENGARTDDKIKQVYFPISFGSAEPEYHLLSIVTPSGLVFIQRERLRASKFSDESKQAREAKRRNEPSASGYDDILDVLTMRFGGSQPQNVSRLNSSNSGEAWMLPCLPPNLVSNYVRVPKTDFFRELRWNDEFRSLVDSAHRLFTVDYNNVNIRDGRKYWFTQMFDWIFGRALIFQSLDPGWSLGERVHLPVWQRYWLDPDAYGEETASMDWQSEVVRAMVRWIMATYRKLYSKRSDAVVLGETDEVRFISELEEFVRDSNGGLL